MPTDRLIIVVDVEAGIDRSDVAMEIDSKLANCIDFDPHGEGVTVYTSEGFLEDVAEFVPQCQVCGATGAGAYCPGCGAEQIEAS